jgi:aerobic-type carbon monoxide dehydrogenase small subunit (CoxS/CutS family)
MASRRRITVRVNGSTYEAEVDVRLLLSDFIRREARLTGTHVGCEHGVCGACTVQVDGRPVRSCLLFAVQANGRDVRTVEDLAPSENELHPLQQAFHECHGLQCGFCTPGFLMSLEPMLADVQQMSDAEIRDLISGNLCRCTGYQGIVDAVRLAAQRCIDPHPSTPDAAPVEASPHRQGTA